MIDKIKTWEDVLKYNNIKDENEILPYKKPKNKSELSLNALAKIQLISKTLNSDWIEDWTNGNQVKYLPYFIRKESGWVVGSCNGCSYGTSSAGFSCYFKSKEIALYATNTFLEIYKDYLP